ncbi:MAG TPA: hypothetical protein VEQ11_05145, partial [Chloroflexota bacterium]|nr:hypothetical protein [Chloroflexota bacterium]
MRSGPPAPIRSRSPYRGTFVHHEPPALDDGQDAAVGQDRGNVRQQIAPNQQQVGLLAHLDRPYLIQHAEQLRAVARGGDQGLHGRDAGLDHQLELSRVLAVIVEGRAGVGPENELHACSMGELEAVDIRQLHGPRLRLGP